MAPELGLTGERAPSADDKRLRDEVLAEAKRRGEGCFYCGAEPEQADHFFPLATGGPRFDKANIVACCAPCNRAKGSQQPSRFLRSRWLANRRQEHGLAGIEVVRRRAASEVGEPLS